jgi:hypothetical protein
MPLPLLIVPPDVPVPDVPVRELLPVAVLVPLPVPVPVPLPVLLPVPVPLPVLVPLPVPDPVLEPVPIEVPELPVVTIALVSMKPSPRLPDCPPFLFADDVPVEVPDPDVDEPDVDEPDVDDPDVDDPVELVPPDVPAVMLPEPCCRHPTTVTVFESFFPWFARRC